MNIQILYRKDGEATLFSCENAVSCTYERAQGYVTPYLVVLREDQKKEVELFNVELEYINYEYDTALKPKPKRKFFQSWFH